MNESTQVNSVVAARVAGVSYRQLDHWVRGGHLGIAHPAGSGNRRSWTFCEVERLALLAATKKVLGRSVDLSRCAEIVSGLAFHSETTVTIDTQPVIVTLRLDLEPVRTAVQQAWNNLE